MNMQDIRQSTSYAKYLQSQGWIVERIDGINYFIKKVPILGSIVKIQRVQKLDFSAIKRLEERYKPFQVIIEPNLATSLRTIKQNHSLLSHYGFKISKSPFLPTKTLQIDLTKPISKITAGFDKDTRRAIKKGEGLIVKEYSTENEIEEFYEAYRKIINSKRSLPSLVEVNNIKKSFPQKDTLYLASHNIVGTIIGGALFTISREINDIVCYYWKAFTNKEGRTSLAQPSLIYQGILWAKKQGCTVFDFEGVYDERFPNKSWLGFSHFKKSFGGYEVLYPGCYTKFILKNVFTFKTQKTPSIQ